MAHLAFDVALSQFDFDTPPQRKPGGVTNRGGFVKVQKQNKALLSFDRTAIQKMYQLVITLPNTYGSVHVYVFRDSLNRYSFIFVG